MEIIRRTMARPKKASKTGFRSLFFRYEKSFQSPQTGAVLKCTTLIVQRYDCACLRTLKGFLVAKKQLKTRNFSPGGSIEDIKSFQNI